MEIPFEISSSAIDGIKLLNDVINEETSRRLIVNAVKQILITGPALPARADIYESSVKSEVKQADFGVCALLLAAAQYDIDVMKLKNFMDIQMINNRTSSQLIESYEKFKEELLIRLERYGNSHNFPTLTDVDYEIQQQISGEILFKLTLKGFDHIKNEGGVISEFYCNHEEIQLLISKFKDIERHCKRISKFE